MFLRFVAMEKIEIKCDRTTVIKEARKIIYYTMQALAPCIIDDFDTFNFIMANNNKRMTPIKFTSKYNFFKKDIEGLIVYITNSKFWWKNVETPPHRAVLVLYKRKMVKCIYQNIKKRRLLADDERDL